MTEVQQADATARRHEPRGRLFFLDSLRGVAALYVIFYHSLLVPQPHPPLTNYLMLKFASFGGTGVYLFFVISGFSLHMTMQRHERTGLMVLSYSVSRLFRIAPLFYVILAYYIVRDNWYLSQPLYLRPVAYNLTFLFNLIPGKQEGIVWASWTIGVEMIFYALFIPLYRSKFRTQLLWFSVSIVTTMIMHLTLPADYVLFSVVGYMPLFIIGMWAYPAYRRLLARPNHAPLAPVLIGAGAAVLIVCALAGEVGSIWERVPIGLAYASILIGAGLGDGDTLIGRIFRFFGLISYSAYLLHPVVIYALHRAIDWSIGSLPGDLRYYATLTMVTIVTTAFAYLTYRLVERPGVRWGDVAFRQLTSRVRSRTNAAPEHE
ncbi:acyltransferase family protein [Sphingomonas sp.]|uniref:acyltransferase family protein n=1 Tax=Sphingomonas sp. TaxID=28214 RepID=UPI003CC6D2BF